MKRIKKDSADDKDTNTGDKTYKHVTTIQMTQMIKAIILRIAVKLSFFILIRFLKFNYDLPTHKAKNGR